MIYVENQGLKEDAPSDGSNTKITLYQDKWETIPINTSWMYPIYCLVIRQEVPTSRIQRQSEEWTLESFGAICEMKEVSKSEVHSAEYKDVHNRMHSCRRPGKLVRRVRKPSEGFGFKHY